MSWNVHFWLFLGGSGRCFDICPHELPFLLVVSSFLLPKTGCMKLTGFAPICGDWTLVSSNFPWKPILFLAVSKCEMGGLPTLPWWLLPGHQVWHCCDWGMLPRKSWVNGWWLDKWFVQINLEWTHTSFPAHSHFVFLRDNLSLAVKTINKEVERNICVSVCPFLLFSISHVQHHSVLAPFYIDACWSCTQLLLFHCVPRPARPAVTRTSRQLSDIGSRRCASQ